MSQLIKLREQIKTIKTIQKITQAMRLVSMSIHSRLNNQKVYLKNYQSELNKIAAVIDTYSNDNSENFNLAPKKLIILIGSQKGLCSSFNQDILRKFLIYKASQPNIEIMVIGKKLIDIMQRKSKIDHKIMKFTPANLSEISSHIFNYITNQTDFNEVFCLSNSSKNFFTHLTKITPLLPIQPNKTSSISAVPEKDNQEPYIWEHPLAEIAKTLTMSQLKLNIYCLLFDSLIAEYAARFRSMDNATRNASELLETTERQYRKVRQAKITRELVELSAIFQTK
jgi:F-type H+-transporting ATPase subunit gamma